MKKNISLLLSLLIIISVLSGCRGNETDTDTGVDTTAATVPTDTGSEIPSVSDCVIGGLRVDYEIEPSCIESSPQFSWTLDTALRSLYQTSYRIRIADSVSKLKSDELIWDSGTVNTADSICKADLGKVLNEAVRYYWDVTVTTNKGFVAVSEPSHFDTALISTGFSGASWIVQQTEMISGGFGNSNWIWLLNGDDQGNVDIKTEYFRKSFNIDKKISSALLAYTADDYGKFYINGKLVAEHRESDGWENAVTADVASVLSTGNNTLACSVVNKQHGYGAALLKLYIVFDDGTTKTVVTDSSWTASEDPGNNWYMPDADESRFKPVNFVMAYGGNPWSTKVSMSNNGTGAPILRTEFEVKGQVRSAMLFASAAGLYEAYVNGKKAGDSALDPGRSEYNKRIMYQCYDVTDSVLEGKNALGAMLGRGWYIGAYSPYGGTVPAFICKLVIDFTDGTRQTVVSDGSWVYSLDGPITYNDIFNGETYDARREITGWNTVNFDQSSWENAQETTESALGIGKLVPQLSGTVKVMDVIEAKSVSKIDNRTYIYDFGQNLAGVPSISFKGREGTVIKLRHAEMLNDGSKGSDGKSGTLYTANLRSALATDTYTSKGDPDGESYTPVFTFHGFRYLEISGLSEALPLEDVKALVLYSDMEDTGAIETSDDLINQLVSNTYWGQRGNFLSTPTDCPQRDERMGWSGDAQIFSGTAAYNMNVKAFFDKYITDLNDCQHDDGAYPDVAPETWRANYSGSGNNAWGDAGVIIPWIMYTRYGDISYIEKYYNNMKRYARYLVNTSNNYIRSRSAYGDWLSIGESTNVAVTDTAYCKYVMDLMAKMADLLDKSGDADFFRGESEKYREAWIKKFATSTGKLRIDTQTAYLVGLAFDIIPDDDKQLFADRLNDKILHNGSKLTTGFIGCPLLLPVLCENGHTDTAFALLQQQEYPSWKYPILQGATTIWERWNSYTIANGFGDAGMNSFNHYSYGSVTEWLYSALVGIKCDENAPGFSSFILDPTSGGGITYAKGEYKSIKGTIKSEWIAESDVIGKYSCTVPGNTTAVLHLNAASIESITESGVPITEAEGISDISISNGIVTMTLGSGCYSFEIK